MAVRIERPRPQFAPMQLPPRPVFSMTVTDTPPTSAPSNNVLPKASSSSSFSADEIVQNVFLGSSNDAEMIEEMEKRGIRNILNVAEECGFAEDVVKKGFRSKKVHLKDHSDADIAAHFDACSEFILSSLQRGEGVLVHCRMGVSRSATIVIAFLMKYGGIYFPSKQSECIARMEAKLGSTLSNSFVDTAADDLQQHSVNSVTPLSNSRACFSHPAASANKRALDAAKADVTAPLSYNDSFDIVKERRRIVAPNLGFCLALREIDVQRGLLEDLWDMSAM